MQSVRKVVKVFIASPGDMNPERKIAREVVEEINALHADTYGYQVEMVGWEETVGSMGRPQEIINRDLARCELFIGMIWKRWGTPPDVNGIFTSGFEEEFTLSIERYNNEGKPQVSMFFKDIEEEFLRDPGDDLKKVLKFKDELIQGKKILFETFTNDKDFEKKLRKRLVTYINELAHNDAKSKAEENKSQSSIEIVEAKEEESKVEGRSPFTEQSFSFINNFITKLKKEGWESTPPTDIAYFKLLSNILNKSNNDDTSLGAHDSNLIYLNSERYQLGHSERLGLIMSGFELFDHHTVPLWKWISENNNLGLEFYSVIAKGQRRRKVIDALRLISHQITVNRGFFLEEWFAGDTSDSIKTSALKYLSELGTESDIDIILKEYENKDISTNNAAVDAIISIRMRDSVAKGFAAIMEYQPISISNRLLKYIKKNGHFLHELDLRSGLFNKNKEIRGICLDLLIDRKISDGALFIDLMSHEDYEIRLNTLVYLTSNNNYNENKEKAKSILKFKDKDGKEKDDKYKEFLKRTLHLETKDNLIEQRETSYLLEADALIALAKKEKKKYIEEIRWLIKDGCESHYKNIVNSFKSEKTLAILKNIEVSVRNNIAAACADWLFQCMDKSDILILRDFLSRKSTVMTNVIANYISKFGEWQDIELIYNANFTQPSYSILGLAAQNNKMMNIAVSAMIKIGKGREDELLALPMNSNLKARLIAQLNSKEFSRVSSNEIKKLLNDEDINIREKLSLKIIECLPKKDIEAIMKDYLYQDTYFYNVVHWLDLGISLKRDVAQKSAR
ncbi:TPA: DUF4062 domain-containing protein, partial [Serratia marcescens]